jgi:hypothetical protein
MTLSANALRISIRLHQVGNEFSSVEALWSQFENFMGTHPDGEGDEEHDEGSENDHDQEGHESRLEEEDGHNAATRESGGSR